MSEDGLRNQGDTAKYFGGETYQGAKKNVQQRNVKREIKGLDLLWRKRGMCKVAPAATSKENRVEYPIISRHYSLLLRSGGGKMGCRRL